MENDRCVQLQKEQVAKSGHFEWCLNWTELKRFVNADTLKVSNGRDAAVLVTGVGTSSLPCDLVNHAGYTNVTAADKDAACVDYMRSCFPNLKWIETDLTSPSCHDDGILSDSYDLIVDKCVYDCIQCEVGNEEAAGYFLEMQKCMTADGIFILISFQNPVYLENLLTTAGFLISACEQVSFYDQPSMPPNSVITLRKNPDVSPPSLDVLSHSIKCMLDKWHSDHPLLTVHERARITSEWAQELQTSGHIDNSLLPIAKAHELLFEPRLRHEFPLQDFISALKEDGILQEEASGVISLQAALDFITDNQ